MAEQFDSTATPNPYSTKAMKTFHRDKMSSNIRDFDKDCNASTHPHDVLNKQESKQLFDNLWTTSRTTTCQSSIGDNYGMLEICCPPTTGTTSLKKLDKIVQEDQTNAP
ncbi:unnamed protein product [Cylindrotheca closterium]|uniref:Uncharacterized protein n=1 Tax=Cylindrotheca closterium TaxID=2856 RepID=A0AAD2CHR8_9STRA|nr:unnamed protein product [Cylindrotheca closterium]